MYIFEKRLRTKIAFTKKLRAIKFRKFLLRFSSEMFTLQIKMEGLPSHS
jgi:hypothetical protein